ncbi:MAG: phage tail tape measure protein, partial [Muribaculaceae bacterium]|nr:phage tail tape measure protein [Muribaculaceae bacterium]
MARMMNVMAAAGQAGSAELPAISAALTQCGMAAKAANVSFEETNAAIQVLDKAGKKASEGGVALRNVLGQLSKGRFVEKQAREELEAIKEIPKVFTAITNQYNYTDLSERTENTIYNINKTFKDAVTNITNYTTRNICFDTFSYGDILTVKPEYRTVNFAGHVFNTSKIENVTNIEELNSLALPSYSTILNYIYPNYNWLNNTNYINNGIENSYKSVVEKIDLQTGGRFNNETLEIKNENRKNSSSESAAELFVSEPLREEKREFERDDIEDIVMDMLRREVELCLR